MESSSREPRVLKFLKGYIASNGEAPTIAEIGEFCGISSTASVHSVLVSLQTAGLIQRRRYQKRGTVIVAPTQESTRSV